MKSSDFWEVFIAGGGSVELQCVCRCSRGQRCYNGCGPTVSSEEVLVSVPTPTLVPIPLEMLGIL